VSHAIIVEHLQRDDDIAVIGQRQSSLCNGGPSYVTAQTLKLLALMRFARDSGVQRKACLLAY
jgi:hypothetical protein